MYWYDNKSLQIPKWYSEALYQRRTDTTMAKEKGENDKRCSSKHYTENQRLSTTNPTKTLESTLVFRYGKQFLLH